MQGRLRRRISLAGVGVAIGIGTGAVPAQAAAPPLTVRAGHSFTTAVSGFAPGTAVLRRLDGIPLPGSVRADRASTVRIRLAAPASPGQHQLLLIGKTASGSASGLGSSEDAVPSEDRQAVVVEIPRVVAIAISVVPSLGVAGEERDRDQDGGSHGTDGARDQRATAATGSDLRLPLMFGGALVLLGGVLTAVGRGPLRARRLR